MPAVALQILLVEDNPDHAFLARRALQAAADYHQLHLDFAVAEDGQTALDYLFCRGPHVQTPRSDFVLLDLQLPLRDGFDVLQELKADPQLRRILVVVLTTSTAHSDILRSHDLQADGYIAKTIGLRDYFRRMEEMVVRWTTVSRLSGG